MLLLIEGHFQCSKVYVLAVHSLQREPASWRQQRPCSPLSIRTGREISPSHCVLRLEVSGSTQRLFGLTGRLTIAAKREKVLFMCWKVLFSVHSVLLRV